MSERWGPLKLLWLRQHYRQTHTPKQCAEYLGKTVASVNSRAVDLGIWSWGGHRQPTVVPVDNTIPPAMVRLAEFDPVIRRAMFERATASG